MLELLQKTLLFIEEQNEWLLYIQSTIQEKEQHYKSLHSSITKEILKEVRKQDVVDADDVKMGQDEVVVKEESCDVTDIEITPINIPEPGEVTSNVDAGASTDQLENDDQLKYEGDKCDVAIIQEEHYQDVIEEDNEHMDDDGDIDVSTNNHSIKHDGENIIGIIKTTPLKDNITSNENIKVGDEEPQKHSIKEKTNRFQCGECSKTFLYKSKLIEHMRIHTACNKASFKPTGEKPYNCNYCEKTFRYNSTRNSHMCIHTGEKPYKCGYCKKSFSRISARNVHLRIHNGEKPFKCKYCEKLFSEAGSRNRHVRIHTGEKPYKCARCNKAFSDIGNRNKHLKTHAGK